MLKPQVSQTTQPTEPPKSGCGCGNANVTTNVASTQSLTEQQLSLLSRIKKTNHQKNSVYKTKNRVFM